VYPAGRLRLCSLASGLLQDAFVGKCVLREVVPKLVRAVT